MTTIKSKLSQLGNSISKKMEVLNDMTVNVQKTLEQPSAKASILVGTVGVTALSNNNAALGLSALAASVGLFLVASAKTSVHAVKTQKIGRNVKSLALVLAASIGLSFAAASDKGMQFGTINETNAVANIHTDVNDFIKLSAKADVLERKQMKSMLENGTLTESEIDNLLKDSQKISQELAIVSDKILVKYTEYEKRNKGYRDLGGRNDLPVIMNTKINLKTGQEASIEISKKEFESIYRSAQTVHNMLEASKVTTKGISGNNVTTYNLSLEDINRIMESNNVHTRKSFEDLNIQ